ncbi:hypothetical protein OG562_06450 [Streptomyces sp. NBC_01275]|uniref:hypothetical protein n=1 Tax=Streptomyces sp. NBC_01275 TaxID=2903807 RepID=UPI0022519E38|nr:hypothetical protein [Streptomyces sp. NBC_01275]MCX4760612.1 hypothetical protein [Streptomyces sp. NBC_01275]
MEPVTSLVLPILPGHDVDLVVPATLQGRTTEERIARRLTVTEPFVTRLALDQLSELGVDPVLLAPLPSGDDYFVVAFVTTFRPAPDGDSASFVDARVGIRLTAPNGGRQPVTLALSPDTASAASGSSLRFALAVPLGVVEPTVEYTAGGSREERYITAYGLGSSDPEWLLRDAPGHPLAGDVLLAVVVRAPTGSAVRAEVVVAASLKRLRLLRSRAELPSRLHTIDLPAQVGHAVFQGVAE